MQPTDTGTVESRAIANRVREMFERKNIGKRQHAAELQRILGLSYSQAHRKMRGLNPWTISQIKAIADFFEESPGSLVENISTTENHLPQVLGESALLIIGGRQYPCVASIGEEIFDSSDADFVAIQRSGWRVYPQQAAPDGIKHIVESIEIHSKQTKRKKPLIAIVDDDSNLTGQLCTALSINGFIGAPFNDEKSFHEALKTMPFDGFVLDWLIGRKTAEESIELIRQSNWEVAPIVLLTGKIDTGEVDESYLAKVAQRFDVLTLEKPARTSILAAELRRRIGVY